MKIPAFRSRLALAAAVTATASAALLSTAGSARAETVYGLTTTSGLFSFDSASPAAVSAVTTITGVTAGQVLVGMDFRPATGQLYALSYVGGTGAAQLYTVNTSSGVATPIGTGITLQAGVMNSRFGFDFNPSVDRVRVIGGYGATAATSGANYRLVPTTGAIAATDTNAAFAAGDVNAGSNPGIIGLAYSNNVAGSSTTTLYGYDYTSDSLVTVGNVNGAPVSPNAGTLFTIGASGVATTSAALDLDIGASGTLFGNLQNGLYTFNVATGAATLVGAIGGGLAVLDIAVQVVPEPSTYALLGAGLAMLLVARRWSARRAQALS